ncbi:hypothetical protein R3P38DRAFT_2771150 [Favolaschia claudopus]|uniref:Zinc finger PHD-type domain-containing protein n=1 Tax=Favolaschia claudopus TaxID=2862362 RepID=A0AAW0CDW4_9AGAR
MQHASQKGTSTMGKPSPPVLRFLFRKLTGRRPFFVYFKKLYSDAAVAEAARPASDDEFVDEPGSATDPIFAPTHAAASLTPLPPIQDNEAEFGFEMPLDPAPGSIPESYPSENDDNEQRGREFLTADMISLLLDTDTETPPSALPPTSGEFIADATEASAPSLSLGAGADWDRPLMPETQGTCECGNILDEAERADSALAIRCAKAGCETEWYYRDCFEGVRFTKGWTCDTCTPPKKHRK